MELIAAFGLSEVLSIVYVALGLGLVIFFHELGHFAVAKWCDVHVERFSIGFGPILWSRKKGETEYALSAIPFGGYVKMLGQDDMDPSQLSSEEIAQDPRSYSAKSVPQRMAIISAGVIMNVLTAILFFAGAFGIGLEAPPSVVGNVETGMPAWVAGIEEGDKITSINGRQVDTFNDITRGVVLSNADIEVKGVRRDGMPFELTLIPSQEGTRRQIGVGLGQSPQIIDATFKGMSPTIPGTAAAKAQPPFELGDTIKAIDGVEVKTFHDMQQILSEHRDRELPFRVARREKGEEEEIEILVPPNPFQTLGLVTDIGKVAAIQNDSIAAKADLRVGDRIIRVNETPVGAGVDAVDPQADPDKLPIDPLKLPDHIGNLHGQDVTLTVSRPGEAGNPQEVSIRLVPEDRQGWTEQPNNAGTPLSIPSIGAAYHLIPTVLKVEPGSVAEKAGIKGLARLQQIRFIRPKGAAGDEEEKADAIPLIKENDKDPDVHNWAHAFWMMQKMPTHDVELKYTQDGKTQTAVLRPQPAENWFVPDRGLHEMPLLIAQKADGAGAALQMGLSHTKDTITDIYSTLRNLFSANLSVKELHGPIGIATVAYQSAKQGTADLLLFLGFLSVNLAVLNFLPIPVLDGGHMVFLVWEAVTRKRPSERVLIAATYVGMAFVLGLMFLVLYLDLVVHRLGGG